MSFKVEIIAYPERTVRHSFEYGKTLRFATKEEARAYAHDLIASVMDARVVECDDPVTDKWPPS